MQHAGLRFGQTAHFLQTDALRDGGLGTSVFRLPLREGFHHRASSLSFLAPVSFDRSLSTGEGQGEG